MKHGTSFLLAGLGIAGLIAGFVTARAVESSSAPSVAAAEAEARSSKASARQAPGTDRGRSASVPPARSTIRSTDTLEGLMALGDDALYGRLALWLMDAPEDQIAAYWAHHIAKEKRSRDITDLVMIAWARVYPQGATAAVAGTSFEQFAWWAWSCHDPAAALEAAVQIGPDRIRNVTWGIGEFHPAWLRENFDRIPEAGRGHALQGLVKWGEVDDALATLEFLKERNRTPPKGLLESLVRQDPWAAYEWVEANGNAMGPVYGSPDQAMNRLIEVLAESNPEVLADLIARQPSGQRKRQMEAAAFNNLLELDLDAALEQARATEAPVVARERLAEVGLRLVRTDPERAFEVAGQLFGESAEALQSTIHIHSPGGALSGTTSYNQNPNALLDALIAHDPERVMEMFAASEREEPDSVAAGGSGALTGGIIGAGGGAMIGSNVAVASNAWLYGGSMTSQVASKWAEQDLEGFAEWVVAQDDAVTTNQHAPGIINQLQNQYRFEEAAEWALGMDDPNQNQLRNLMRGWERVDPDAANAWQEAAGVGLPEPHNNEGPTRFIPQVP